ncbi:hypothetical protein MPTK1_8g13910 [Marchantia polymorpha subsp. ruderalis]|uniref:Uncharacterized protein n=1 Tax=Marchantia polymorpha TaxID=3197 RepID=A0A2R6WCT8_MARPO|nr:hypothetical protein MARPO_0108s0015 [Marchantia polymorpha]BBN19818.1 hypothetical protein Mp_8g13910 [Marchantia polymorpha subsp. ruderalis]|eukprot:PTQ31666.1 hypothetical protein MARPO_0108s0015 [Marchantia polymorpha]
MSSGSRLLVKDDHQLTMQLHASLHLYPVFTFAFQHVHEIVLEDCMSCTRLIQYCMLLHGVTSI